MKKPVDEYFPLPSQLLCLVILVFMMSSFGSGVVQFTGKLLELDYFDIVAGIHKGTLSEDKNFVRYGIIISQLFTFAIPAVLFTWFIKKKESFSYLLLQQLPTMKVLGGTLALVLFAFPLVQGLFWLNKQVALPNWALEQEALVNNTIFSLLFINQPYELLLNIFAIGLIPAIGEELLFRGIIQQKLSQLWNRPQFAIWGTALLFSLIHFQFQGFLPRVFLGATLGYLFWWTNNLWIPILAHFLYNTNQVIIQHLYYTKQQSYINLESFELFSLGVMVGSLFGFFVVARFISSSK